MAWSITERGEADQHASSADLLSDTFTPAADTLLVAVVTEDSGGVTDITGHEGGGDWVSIGSIAAGNITQHLWAAFSGGSPSSGQITLDVPYCWNVGVEFFEVGGADTSGTVAAALGTMVSESGYDVQNHSVTLSAFSSSSNMTFAFGSVNSGSGTNFVFEGSYTELTPILIGAGPDLTCQIAWNDGEDTNPTATVTSFVDSLFSAIEIKEAAASGASVPIGPLTGVFGGPLTGKMFG